MSDTMLFLNALFQQKPTDSHILVWTLPDKESYWFTDTAQASKLAATKDGKDVYFGVGVSPKPFGLKGRCKANDIAGIPGLWLDIDYGVDGHKKGNLPSSEEEAQALIDAMGAKPTIVVHSGHGLQVYWLFAAFWKFDSDEDRDNAKSLSELWKEHFKRVSKSKGFDGDSVQDLARVMRLPGSVNHKEPVAPVRVLSYEKDVVYNPVDLQNIAIQSSGYEIPGKTSKKTSEKTTTSVKPEGLGILKLDSNAHPPFEKFDILNELDPKFAASWAHERRDMQDQSPSSYDMALCNLAVLAGWNDQEITNLLIAHRRKHKADLKLREDYYRRTINRARNDLQRAEADEAIEESLEKGAELTEEERAGVVENLASVFGVPIIKIIKYTGEQPTYRLVMRDGSILLGGIASVTNQTTFRNQVAAACGILIPMVKAPQWEKRVQALLNACEVQENPEATEEGRIFGWLTCYLDAKHPSKDADDTLHSQHPFVKEDRIYIYGNDLRKWLLANQGERVSQQALGQLLRVFGAEPYTLGGKINGKATTRSTWVLPESFKGGNDGKT